MALDVSLACLNFDHGPGLTIPTSRFWRESTFDLANDLSQTLFASPKCVGRRAELQDLPRFCHTASTAHRTQVGQAPIVQWRAWDRAWLHVWKKIAQHFQAQPGSTCTSGMDKKPFGLGSTEHLQKGWAVWITWNLIEENEIENSLATFGQKHMKSKGFLVQGLLPSVTKVVEWHRVRVPNAPFVRWNPVILWSYSRCEARLHRIVSPGWYRRPSQHSEILHMQLRGINERLQRERICRHGE